jgi:hypothetical protein
MTIPRRTYVPVTPSRTLRASRLEPHLHRARHQVATRANLGDLARPAVRPADVKSLGESPSADASIRRPSGGDRPRFRAGSRSAQFSDSTHILVLMH